MSGTINLVGPLESPGAAPITAPVINTAVNAALATKVAALDGELTDPTVVGGTIAGASISGGTISSAAITGGTISGTAVSGVTVTATSSTTARTLADRAADVANVLDYGAGIGGDDAAAIRAAIASGKKIIYVPPGTYVMKSTLPTYGTAVDPSHFEIRGKTDTYIIAYGATFTVADSISGPVPTTILSFTSNSKNVGIFGGTFVGNVTGLTSSQENVAINFCAVTNLTVRDVKVSGQFLTAISGVYAFDSHFDNVQAYNNANSIDVAHLEHVTFSNCHFRVNPAHVVSGINLHYDTPTLADNDVTNEDGTARTLVGGITNNIRVIDCTFDGFGNGIAIDAAAGVLISRTIIRNGLVASSASTQSGVFLYQGTAAVTAGLTLTDVTIEDCDIYGNGLTAGGGTGCGVHVGSATGTIKNINIIRNRIYDNTANAIASISTTAVSNLLIEGNDFRTRSGGTLQTVGVSASLVTSTTATGSMRGNTDLATSGLLAYEGTSENGVSDAGTKNSVLRLTGNQNSGGFGGAIEFGGRRASGGTGANGSGYFGSIKGALVDGSNNTTGTLDVYLRAANTDTALTKVGSWSSTGLTASVLPTGATTSRTLAARFASGYDIRDFGALQDGTTDDAAAINAAIVAATAASKPVFIFNTGNNIVVGSAVALIKNACILGFGRPVIFLKAAANCAVLQSSGFQANIGPTTFTDGDANIVLDGLVIDGNRANQTASGTPEFQTGVSIYGTFPTITNCTIRGAYGHGVRLGGVIYVAATLTGFEPVVTNLHVNNCGRNGIWYQGPSDGHFSDVMVVDAGQATDNTYFGILSETSGRYFNYHGWHISTATNRVAYQGKFAASSDIIGSHFEGGRKQLNLSGGTCRVLGSLIYSNFGAAGNPLIDISSNSNQIIGCGITNTAGLNEAYGVNFSNSAAGNFLTGNYYTGLKVYGPFNFTLDGGLNVINDRGFMAGGGATAFGGSPLSNNEINYYQGGSVIDTNTTRRIDMQAGPSIRSGSGAASGTQPKGSVWMRTDGGVGTTMYVSQGAGVWNAVAGV